MKKIFIAMAAFASLAFACNIKAQQRKMYRDASVEQFEQMICSDTIQVLDVRTMPEYRQGHLAGAMLIDFKADTFITACRQHLDKARPIAIYCRSGRRSAAAAQALAQEGYNVTNMLGGIVEWQSKGKSVER